MVKKSGIITISAFSKVIITGLVFAATTSAFLLGALNQAHACSCAPPRSPIEELSQRSTVFEGKVVDIDTDNLDQIVTFDVYKTWKGLAASDGVIKIVTPTQGSSCGYDFEEGREYMVYANGGSGTLEVNHCSRTASVSDAYMDLVALGSGIDVDANTIPPYASKDPSGGAAAYDTMEDPMIYARVFLPVVIMVAIAGSAAGMGIVILRSRPKEGQKSV